MTKKAIEEITEITCKILLVDSSSTAMGACFVMINATTANSASAASKVMCNVRNSENVAERWFIL